MPILVGKSCGKRRLIISAKIFCAIATDTRRRGGSRSSSSNTYASMSSSVATERRGAAVPGSPPCLRALLSSCCCCMVWIFLANARYISSTLGSCMQINQPHMHEQAADGKHQRTSDMRGTNNSKNNSKQKELH